MALVTFAAIESLIRSVRFNYPGWIYGDEEAFLWHYHPLMQPYVRTGISIMVICAITAFAVRFCWRWKNWEMLTGIVGALLVMLARCFYYWSIPWSEAFFFTLRLVSLSLFPLLCGWGLGWWLGGVMRTWFRRRRQWSSENLPVTDGRRRIFMWLWFLSTLASLGFWWRFWPDAYGIVPAWHTVNMDYLRTVESSLANSPVLTVYEGLPRGLGPNRSLTPGEAAAPVRRSMVELFFATPVDVSAADSRKLHDLLSARTSFLVWHGEKMCDFHPDWAIAWTGPDRESYETQLCFTCGEAKILGPWGILYLDDEPWAYHKLKELLTPYHVQR
ncbi:MAG: hypothetical protein ABSH19_01640 [Opitutales bacterium]